MKKTSSPEKPDELRNEYDFDFKRMRPNRFAKRLKGKSVVAVVLDSDVADVFQSSEAVNDLLRSVIKAMPEGPRPAARKRRAS
jgi:uncharacterized protein (DUF4415 family)